MSDAINYLKEIRPEAVEAYFTFLSKSAEHLDDKTRFLISVITKVDKQTEKGFRQYVKRALKEGNSANEIIDALLVAFPTLGLSKIIWAVEQISEMGLSEFAPENLKDKAQWYDVSSLSSINDGINYFTINGVNIFVNKENDLFTVYEAKCPHNNTPLQLEDASGDCITCPKHQWVFNLSSGECIEGGNKALVEYRTKIENEILKIYI